MALNKHQLNDQQWIRETYAKNMVEMLKKDLIRNISMNNDSKEATFTYSFELGQDLLIEKIIEIANQEFINMLVEHLVSVYYDPKIDQERMCLKLRLNWHMDLNEGFIIYSSDEEQS